MEYRLPAIWPRVRDQAVTVFGNPSRLRELARDGKEMSHQLFIFRLERVDRFDMPVRHDQDVGRRDGVNIAERSDLFVAINDHGFGFIRDDPAEMA